MSKPIRIGVLGYANIAKRSVIPAINALPDDFVLDSVARRSLDQSESELSEIHGGDFRRPKFINGYTQLLGRQGIEAVYVPLPTGLHYEWVKKALLSGRHVLVEKSLAVNFSQVEELVGIAKSKGLVLMETFQFRFHPQFKLIADMVKTGVIGRVRAINTIFSFPPFKESSNIRYQKKLGGGALLDAGAYTVKIAQMLSPGRLTVRSAALSHGDEYEVDLWGGAHLVDADNRISAHLGFGFDNSYRCFVEVAGSGGRVLSERIFTAPPDFEATVEQHTMSGETIRHKFAPENHFKLMLRHFAEACVNQKPRDAEYEGCLEQGRLLHDVARLADLA